MNHQVLKSDVHRIVCCICCLTVDLVCVGKVLSSISEVTDNPSDKTIVYLVIYRCFIPVVTYGVAPISYKTSFYYIFIFTLLWEKKTVY